MIRKIAFLMILIGLIGFTGCASNTADNDTSEDEYIRIPISDISDNMIKLSHQSQGTDIKFFAVKGSGGTIRTAFDACDVCGGHKGYTQIGSDVRCNNCGRMFKIDDIGKLNSPGGCWPSFLSHVIEDDSVLVKISEIEQGQWRFA